MNNILVNSLNERIIQTINRATNALKEMHESWNFKCNTGDYMKEINRFKRSI